MNMDVFPDKEKLDYQLIIIQKCVGFPKTTLNYVVVQGSQFPSLVPRPFGGGGKGLGTTACT